VQALPGTWAIAPITVMNTCTAPIVERAGDFSWNPRTEVILVLTALAVILISTRVLSGRSIFVSTDYKTVPPVPYWIPFFGHAVDLGFRPDKLLKGTRDSSNQGVFSIFLGGSTHNMVYAPSLVQNIFSQRPTVIKFDSIIWHILRNVGGVPMKYKKPYEDAFHGLNAAISNNLLREPSVSKMVRIAVRNFEVNMPNLVSFMPSPVDQSPWERGSNPKVLTTSEHLRAMEVSLL